MAFRCLPMLKANTLQMKQAAMSLDGDTHVMNLPRASMHASRDAGKTGSLSRLRSDSRTSSGTQAGWRPAVFVGPNSKGVRLSGDGDALRKVGNDRLRRPRRQSQAQSQTSAIQRQEASAAPRGARRQDVRPASSQTMDPTMAEVEERRRARALRREGIAEGTEPVAAAQASAPREEAPSSVPPKAAGKTSFFSRHKVLISLVAVFAILLSFYGPVRSWYVSQRTNQDLQAQYDQLNSANDALRSEVDALQTQEGIEDAARERGYVDQGETAVTITDGPEADSSDSASASDSTSDTISGQSTARAETDALTDILDVIFQYHFGE